MADNPDPTKDSAFKKVVDYFLRTPPQPKGQPKRQTDSGKPKRRSEASAPKGERTRD